MDDSTSLRKRVEAILPTWQSWYPSVFDAAVDLGLLRARVCAPSSLLLSNRHAGVQSAAEQAHREKWGGIEDQPEQQGGRAPSGGKRRKRRRKKS